MVADAGIVHERSAPRDHNQSAFIDRECRTLLEGVQTAMIQSGAPVSFWSEAAKHFAFTRNNVPRHKKSVKGREVFVSANNIFENSDRLFNLTHLVAFGTQATCYLPPERREGGKGPGQGKTFNGVIIGYVEDMSAYRVFDLGKRKVREVSFNFCVISEGFYPFKNESL